ncbi:MAG: helix-turn-helix domain-containing protein [Candidatus Peribacteraceae bacterium]|nr:helix-turn-helix domain-containing protein [Candidatus Peribacteraceae bacterium]
MSKLTQAQIKKIKSLASKGLSERAIAKQVGCSRSAVWYHKNNQ